MVPGATAVANAGVCALQHSGATRSIDTLTGPLRRAPRTVVERARPEHVPELMALAQRLIGGQLAPEHIIREVASRHPDAVWIFSRQACFIGGIAILMLNAAGLKALLSATLDTFNPDPGLLSEPGEAPAGIYLWGFGQLSGSEGVLRVLQRFQEAPYRSANVYARPVTEHGLRFLTSLGFQPVPAHPGGLYGYVRPRNELN
jgi:hypothetical protein